VQAAEGRNKEKSSWAEIERERKGRGGLDTRKGMKEPQFQRKTLDRLGGQKKEKLKCSGENQTFSLRGSENGREEIACDPVEKRKRGPQGQKNRRPGSKKFAPQD